MRSVRDYDGIHKLWAAAHAAGSPTKFVRNAVVFRELAGLVPGLTLDAGCGMGEYSIFLAEKGHKVIAFDPSRYAVNALAASCGSNMRIEARISRLEEFRYSRRFDNIVSIEVIEHIELDEVAIRKLYCLLKPDGTLVISAPAVRLLFGEADKMSGHFRRYSHYEFKKMLFKTGFSEVTVKGYGFPVLFFYTLMRKLFFERAVIRHFSKAESGSFAKSVPFSRLYPYMLAIDQFNIPLLGIGYVAVCRK